MRAQESTGLHEVVVVDDPVVEAVPSDELVITSPLGFTLTGCSLQQVLESTDINMLRRLEIESWRRAERLETEYAKAVHAKIKAVEEKKVVQAKFDALVSENETLLARIAELTRQIAFATNRDLQLALELELTELRTQLANSNDLVWTHRHVPLEYG